MGLSTVVQKHYTDYSKKKEKHYTEHGHMLLRSAATTNCSGIEINVSDFCSPFICFGSSACLIPGSETGEQKKKDLV